MQLLIDATTLYRKQGYYIFSRATKITKLVVMLATNDLHEFSPLSVSLTDVSH